MGVLLVVVVVVVVSMVSVMMEILLVMEEGDSWFGLIFLEFLLVFRLVDIIGECFSEEFIIKEEFCVQLADDGLFTFRNAFLKLSDKKAYKNGFTHEFM